MELETERPRLSFFRLPVFLALRVRLGRVQEPKRQVALRPPGLCVCRLGLLARRHQVHPKSMEWTLLLEVVLRPVDLCVCRLELGEGRRDHPERMEWTLLLEIALRPVRLCVYRLGLPARRQVGLGFDSGRPAQIRLSFCPLEAASRAELLWLLHQLAESLRVARPVFLCALFRALPEMAKPEPLPERNLAMLQHLAEAADPLCLFVYLVQMVTRKSRAPLKSSGLRRSRAMPDQPRRLAAEYSSGSRS